MVEGNHRNTEAVINLRMIENNVKAERKRMDKQQKLFAVVKANAYGHGIIPVAHAAKKAGANGFCVAIVDEALVLRQAGITDTILILGVTPADQAGVLAEKKISVAVGEVQYLHDALDYLKTTKGKLRVHLALDTGMGRIGFRSKEELKKAVTFIISQKECFIFEGIFTHFATADSADDSYYKKQLTNFKELMSIVKNKPPFVHVANSAAALWHRECGGNAVRFGIAMYGLNPSGSELKLPKEFTAALSLKSEIVAIKEISAGDSVGYGKTYTATKPEWIATVPIGYADGWPRRMQGFKVLIDGYYCEIVGRVCMDQIMVKVPEAFKLGTTVTLIGEDHGKSITAQDVADYAQTIHYEVLCGISQRVQRKYI
ncbi:alanine racemase [Liquorilactobacillus capillatus]|uniref:Alanine racemase n=1 Tax=Liquorilactobacillus capillatus DSM 19910 TaxID=1423731 RepID=A0A0R1M1H7_9LACO|nr:alanine racemase [Liquorilactobacillus capillatus]KRL01855.1 alanine racemase [Liquorilactobacillus capillatus DSM 19910]